MHIGTNDADKVGTTELLESYRQLVMELQDSGGREECVLEQQKNGDQQSTAAHV